MISRRSFLAGLGVATAGAVVGSTGVLGAQQIANADNGGPTISFFGDHQAGIVTPQQDRLCFASFDIVSNKREDVLRLLREWTQAASVMCAGEPTGSVAGDPNAPPGDTGEAMDLTAARLTMTFGFGPTFFTKDGIDRFGVAEKRPAALVEIPPFVGDQLRVEQSGGDICVQACADDPQVAFHAVRNLARIGRGIVVMRWNQLGFGRTASTSRTQETPRNLMGLKDGTNNLKAEDVELLRDQLWVQSEDGMDWMVGGSYLVTRRIRMLIEIWDRSGLDDQEKTIGRHKVSGAPLGKKNEHDDVDLDEVDARGEPVIPADAHVRLSMPKSNNGAHLLRRGYSFTDGMDSFGQLDAGLFFIAFQRDPRKQFIPVQENLSKNDTLNEYIKHTGSAIFAVPPGIKEGSFIGAGLF